jgi:hypothetical protein
MRIAIRRIGNPKGMIIPAALLEHAHSDRRSKKNTYPPDRATARGIVLRSICLLPNAAAS